MRRAGQPAPACGLSDRDLSLVEPFSLSRTDYCFSSKATASAQRGAALYEIIERLLRFDPLPYDPALDT